MLYIYTSDNNTLADDNHHSSQSQLLESASPHQNIAYSSNIQKKPQSQILGVNFFMVDIL